MLFRALSVQPVHFAQHNQHPACHLVVAQRCASTSSHESPSDLPLLRRYGDRSWGWRAECALCGPSTITRACSFHLHAWHQNPSVTLPQDRDPRTNHLRPLRLSCFGIHQSPYSLVPFDVVLGLAYQPGGNLRVAGPTTEQLVTSRHGTRTCTCRSSCSFAQNCVFRASSRVAKRTTATGTSQR